VIELLTVEQVAPLLGMSRRSLHELTRLGRVPHRVLPHGRRCLFEPAWLEAWKDGCELERVELPAGGRIVRPKGSGS
jgi:hypothetical protein